ncbi:hypothetical protein T265_15551, partial [Opisthorchis viverrini]
MNILHRRAGQAEGSSEGVNSDRRSLAVDGKSRLSFPTAKRMSIQFNTLGVQTGQMGRNNKNKNMTFDRDRQLSIKPHSETEAGQKRKSEGALAIQLTGVLRPTVLKDDKSGGEKLHVEIPADPEFTADDLLDKHEIPPGMVDGPKGTTCNIKPSFGQPSRECLKCRQIANLGPLQHASISEKDDEKNIVSLNVFFYGGKK